MHANIKTGIRYCEALSVAERVERLAWRVDLLPDGLRAALLGALGGAGVMSLIVLWVLLA